MLIANPRAGGGRGAAAIGTVARRLRDAGLEVDIRPTLRAGHAPDLAARAMEEGCRLLLALGGDGTLNEVVRGVLARGPAPPDLWIAPVPSGTGNSFVRDFGLSPRTHTESVRRILAGAPRPIDACRVSYRERGQVQHTYFVNLFGIGLGARIAETTNRSFKALGGAGYQAAVFWNLLRLAAPRTRLEIEGPDGTVTRDEPLLIVLACNSQWTGNGMWIAPHADPSDGVLELLALGPTSRFQTVKFSLDVYTGAHLRHPAVQRYRARRFSVAPAVPSPLLLDGEVFGSTPATVELLPGALQMLV